MTTLLLLLLSLQDTSANDLLRDALKEAKEKNKKVLLTFGAPG